MTDKQIEEEIQSKKNLNAPRLTPEIIETKKKKNKICYNHKKYIKNIV